MTPPSTFRSATFSAHPKPVSNRSRTVRRVLELGSPCTAAHDDGPGEPHCIRPHHRVRDRRRQKPQERHGSPPRAARSNGGHPGPTEKPSAASTHTYSSLAYRRPHGAPPASPEHALTTPKLVSFLFPSSHSSTVPLARVPHSTLFPSLTKRGSARSCESCPFADPTPRQPPAIDRA
ncbi:hypothetical protein C8Q80DRAFT_237623 [Daedaleopsis nitida]|nr:hypothetical protein C8Q80DRAFT_237623 [Daedaleopsis nitida]